MSAYTRVPNFEKQSGFLAHPVLLWEEAITLLELILLKLDTYEPFWMSVMLESPPTECQ